LETQLTLDKQENRESDSGLYNLAVAGMRRLFDEDKIPINSEIEHYLVEESKFNFVIMHLLNHFSDHIHQLGNLLNVSSKLPERVIMDLKQSYQQANAHEAAAQILQTNG